MSAANNATTTEPETDSTLTARLAQMPELEQAFEAAVDAVAQLIDEYDPFDESNPVPHWEPMGGTYLPEPTPEIRAVQALILNEAKHARAFTEFLQKDRERICREIAEMNLEAI